MLIESLAKAHRWWKALVSERCATMREIARAYQIDERYLSRIVTLAFLPLALAQ